MHDTTRSSILLVAINARFSHTSFAARSLKANLGALAHDTAIMECDLTEEPWQLAGRIVSHSPRITGFSAYLWNIRTIEATVRILREVAPGMTLVVGGPEITADYPYINLFDGIIIGEGEGVLRDFCENALNSSWQAGDARSPLVIKAPDMDLEKLALPYDLYTEGDLAHRTIYAESSRGCPWRCGYCTSADTKVRLIPLESLLAALGKLWQRGVRRLKFLDRSFNAPVAHARGILEFFLARVTADTSLHFEIQPEYLHPGIAALLQKFPAHTLHLEVGVQTLNPQVAAVAGRSADTGRTLDNLRFLTRKTGADVHADLIFGLPGESEDSFAHGFNTLLEECAPPVVQVNLLKGLPGTRFACDAESLGLKFNAEPPYELLHSDAMDFATVARIQRFARCWELVYNRGHFPAECRMLLGLAEGDPYALFQRLALHISGAEGRLFAISRPRLAALLQQFVDAHHAS